MKENSVRLLISVAAYQSSPVLRKLIRDLIFVKNELPYPAQILLIFDRPSTPEDKFFLKNRQIKTFFKPQNKGETDSVNLAGDYARLHGFFLLIHLDDDIKINRGNFRRIVGELLKNSRLKVVSAKMLRLAPYAKFPFKQMNVVCQKILDLYYQNAHYVDGRFFIIRVKDLLTVPLNTHSDHFLTLNFASAEIAITSKTTAFYVVSCNFGEYFRCQFKYRLNEEKIKYLSPDLYKRQREICVSRLGDKITGIPKNKVKEIYRSLSLLERSYHRLDRFLIFIAKFWTRFVFFLCPQKYLLRTSWRTETKHRILHTS